MSLIWRILIIVAVLFAPLSMAGEHAAMAVPAPQEQTMMGHGQAGAAGHCADMGSDQPDRSDRSSASIDCMMVCSALPTLNVVVDNEASLLQGLQPATPVSALVGVHLEADPPPPRRA
jgi:hypothetical protein